MNEAKYTLKLTKGEVKSIGHTRSLKKIQMWFIPIVALLVIAVALLIPITMQGKTNEYSIVNGYEVIEIDWEYGWVVIDGVQWEKVQVYKDSAYWACMVMGYIFLGASFLGVMAVCLYGIEAGGKYWEKVVEGQS